MKKNIYFICNGNSMNDIIHSINNIKQNSLKKSFFNYIYSNDESNNKSKPNKKLKLLDDPPLIHFGIKELNLCQENKDNHILFQNFKNIYTSLDTSSIESVLILYQSISNSTIYPLPYMTTNNQINDTATLDTFKNKFGKTENNITKVSKYWSSKKNKEVFSRVNVKNNTINTSIDWKYISTYNTKKSILKNKKSIRSQSQFGFNAFEKELINICKNDLNNDILFVSNHDILEKILSKCKSTKFNLNKNIIEVTSIWKIEIDILEDKINYTNFNKIYPTINNFKPLEQYNKQYKFNFNNYSYTLLNSRNPIPIEYIETFNIELLPNNIKEKIIKIFHKYNKTNNHEHIININSKIINLENFK
jgi:hypothetical protein